MATNSQVAHAFAHKQLKYMHTNNRNMFRAHHSGHGSHDVDKDTIYSYGYHFPIARHTTLPNGRAVVMLTTRTYSPSTARHVAAVSMACSHLTKVMVHNPSADNKRAHKENYLAMTSNVQVELRKSAKARKYKVMYYEGACIIQRRANEYSKLFKLGFRAVTLDPLEVSNAQYEKAIKLEREDVKRKEQQRATEQKHIIKAWLHNERVNLSYSGVAMIYGGNAYVRVKGDVLETSKGSKVPLNDAIQLFKLMKRCAANSFPWVATDYNMSMSKIDGFPVQGIDSDGTLKVSCHTITLEAALVAAEIAGIEL